MKSRGFLFILLIAVLLVCPLAAMGEKSIVPKTEETTDAADNSSGDSILVLSSSTKKINEVDATTSTSFILFTFRF